MVKKTINLEITVEAKEPKYEEIEVRQGPTLYGVPLDIARAIHRWYCDNEHPEKMVSLIDIREACGTTGIGKYLTNYLINELNKKADK